MGNGWLRRKRANKLLLLALPIIFLSVISASTVTITKNSYSDQSGIFLKPYYENINSPITGCTSPCLSVDTSSTIPNPTSGTLSLDGSATGTWASGSSFTITATTAGSNDVIILWIITYFTSSITVSSISDSSALVSWQGSARTSYATCTVPRETTQTEWYGIASTPITTDVITVHLSGTPTLASGEEFAVTGADTASPFDTNANVPEHAISSCSAANAAPTVTGVSTSNLNDFVFSLYGGYTSKTETAGAIAGTASTLIKTVAGTGDSSAAEYRIVSSTESGVSCAFGSTTTYWGIDCDALVQAAGSFALPAASSMYLWSPQFSSATSIPAGVLSFQLFASPPPPTLDGSANGAWTTGTTFTIPSLSTTKTNDVVVLSIVANDGATSVTVSSVADSQGKITWQGSPRSSSTFCAGTQKSSLTEWYGIASTAITADTITITLSTTPISASGISFGAAGADTTTPFDPASSLPAGATSACSATTSVPSVTAVSTDAHTDFIFSLFGGYTSVTESAGTIGGTTGAIVTTRVGTGESNAVEYLPVSSKQSSVACNFGTSTTYWRILCDALMPERQSITVSYETTNSAGTIQSTLISSTSATITALFQPVSLTSSAGNIPALGYILVVITAPSSVALTVYWGYGDPTLFESAFNYQT